MINDLFNYNLKIYQDVNAFKYSIDSVLLAEFININLRCKNIIDLCSGNAPIPMILSKKFNNNIVGVEIQNDIYNLGKKSIEINNINNILFLNKDIKEIDDMFNYKFDIVCCNPPYFKYNSNSIINDNKSKAIARHEIMITLEDIVKIAGNIIVDSGSLYLVHRCDRMIELFDILKCNNFGLRRLQFVYDNYNSNSCLLLVEAKYNCKNDLKVCNPLYICDFMEDL